MCSTAQAKDTKNPGSYTHEWLQPNVQKETESEAEISKKDIRFQQRKSVKRAKITGTKNKLNGKWCWCWCSFFPFLVHFPHLFHHHHLLFRFPLLLLLLLLHSLFYSCKIAHDMENGTRNACCYVLYALNAKFLCVSNARQFSSFLFCFIWWWWWWSRAHRIAFISYCTRNVCACVRFSFRKRFFSSKHFSISFLLLFTDYYI